MRRLVALVFRVCVCECVTVHSFKYVPAPPSIETVVACPSALTTPRPAPTASLVVWMGSLLVSHDRGRHPIPPDGVGWNRPGADLGWIEAERSSPVPPVHPDRP